MPAQQDKSTVSIDGTPKQQLIDGVVIRHAITQTDERGTLWRFLTRPGTFIPRPLSTSTSLRSGLGKVRGWHVHHLHDDRIFISLGTLKVVLYDDRPDSPTYQMINKVYRTELDRTIMIIPKYVFHAHQNVGTTDALLVSMPTRAYNHEDPDVFRLPVNNDYISYRFEERIGW